MARYKDFDWNLPEGVKNAKGGMEHGWQSIHSALLMDIRDELKRLNSLLYCPNFLQIPYHLEAIRQNTKKKRCKKQ
jgi:hypothetical protein